LNELNVLLLSLSSYAVLPVVYVGTSSDAVSSLRRMLDLLEEVWWTQDADTARSVCCNDFLFLAARLVAYWPALIHAVEPPAYTVVT